jgi:hypothetical protein
MAIAYKAILAALSPPPEMQTMQIESLLVRSWKRSTVFVSLTQALLSATGTLNVMGDFKRETPAPAYSTKRHPQSMAAKQQITVTRKYHTNLLREPRQA